MEKKYMIIIYSMKSNKKDYLTKDNMDLNNKFGKCCRCPALMSDGHLFTNWESSRLYNDAIRRNYGISGSNSYREILQFTGAIITANEQTQYEKARCVDDYKNKFYIDSSKWKPELPLKNEYKGQKIPHLGFKQSQPSSF